MIVALQIRIPFSLRGRSSNKERPRPLQVKFNSRNKQRYFVLALFVLDGFAAGLTFSWLTTFFTPSVSFAMRSASAFASAVSTVPRRVTSLLTTSTLIFLSGVLV